MELIVTTERLGWPGERWWTGLLLIQTSGPHQYEDDPDRPTATCHLQADLEQPALCGYEWEGLIAIPSGPRWYELHPDLRCDECAAGAGLTDTSQDTFIFDYLR